MSEDELRVGVGVTDEGFSAAMEQYKAQLEAFGKGSDEAKVATRDMMSAMRESHREQQMGVNIWKEEHEGLMTGIKLFNEVGSTVGKVQNMFQQYNIMQIRVQKANEDMKSAQEKVNEAQEKLNALMSSGTAKASDIAKAQANLKQAQDDLKDATDKVNEAQSQQNAQLVGFALQIPSFIGNIVQMGLTLSTLGTIFPALGGGISMVSGAFSTLNLALGPIGWALLAIAAVVAIFAAAWINDWGGIREKTQWVIDGIVGALKWFADFIGGIARAIGGFFDWLTGKSNDTVNQVQSNTSKIQGEGQRQQQAMQQTSQQAQAQTTSTTTTSTTTATTPATTATTPATTATAPAGGGRTTYAHAAQFGGAGIVNQPTLFLAGEAGPEAYAFSPLGRAGGPALGNINVNIYTGPISNRADVDYLYETFSRRLREEMKRSSFVVRR